MTHTQGVISVPEQSSAVSDYNGCNMHFAGIVTMSITISYTVSQKNDQLQCIVTQIIPDVQKCVLRCQINTQTAQSRHDSVAVY